MFREMRRKNQALPPEECVRILNRGSSGVMAAAGDDGYPYAVPLSYVYDDGKLFFHCAKTGHKLDAIARNHKVSFCVTDQDKVMPEEYTSYFRSVIVFGTARVLDNDAEKRSAIEKLAEKYTPENREGRQKEIKRLYEHLNMLELSVEHMTGKEAIELVRLKQRAAQ